MAGDDDAGRGEAEPADIAIVGAGAAGLAAAIFAAEASPRKARVVLLDGAARVGAKILIAGGGRCNVTHAVVRPEDFNGPRPVVRNILAAFGAKEAADWFATLGVALKREETGKLFPTSDRARTVLDALLSRCAELGVVLRERHRVDGVEALPRGGFEVRHAHGRLRGRCLVLAPGGRSLPKTGSDGSGYDLARALGHTVTETFPALVPLVLEGGPFDHAGLAGISHDAELTTRSNGRVIDRRTGSLLWTHFGISGPVVLDASRHWVGAKVAGLEPTVTCSFLPGEASRGVESWIDHEARARPQRPVVGVVAGRLPARLAALLVRVAGIEPELRLANFAREGRGRLARVLTQLPLPVTRDRGWSYAEVTAGGVPLDEVDFRTLQSRRAPGAHLAGEILDCDGRIGGFNFQWAWSTGFLAGRACAAAIARH